MIFGSCILLVLLIGAELIETKHREVAADLRGDLGKLGISGDWKRRSAELTDRGRGKDDEGGFEVVNDLVEDEEA